MTSQVAAQSRHDRPCCATGSLFLACNLRSENASLAGVSSSSQRNSMLQPSYRRAGHIELIEDVTKLALITAFLFVAVQVYLKRRAISWGERFTRHRVA